MELGVDKSTLLLFTATTGVTPFAQTVLQLPHDHFDFLDQLLMLLSTSDCSFNMYESMLSSVGFSLDSGNG